MAGRNPKPLAVKQFQGSVNPSREKARNQIIADVDVPEMPERFLGDAERIKLWDKLASTLSRMKVVSHAEYSIMERFVDWQVFRAKALEDCDKSIFSDTNQRSSQGFIAIQKIDNEIAKMEVQLGMTPSARTRVAVKEEEKKTSALPFFSSVNDDEDDE